MDEVDGVHGEHAGAGHYCPARRLLDGSGGGPSESIVDRERLRAVQATEKEQAAITQLLKERAESAPAGVGVGHPFKKTVLMWPNKSGDRGWPYSFCRFCSGTTTTSWRNRSTRPFNCPNTSSRKTTCQIVPSIEVIA